MTCPVSPTCLFARLHAPRIVWPACVQHCVARIHARMHACVGARACACARAACSPARPARPGCVRSDFPEPAVRARALPACPTAFSPSSLSLLSGAGRPVSLAQTMMVPVVRTAVRTALPNSCPSRVFSRDGGAVGRCPLHAAPAKSGASDVATGAANPFEIARDSRVGTGCRFFSRFRVHPASSGPSE